MSQLKELLDQEAHRIDADSDALNSMLLRRDSRRRNKRITAGVVGIAVFVVAVWIVTSGGTFDRSRTPAAPRDEKKPAGSLDGPGRPGRVRGSPPASGVPEVDYVIDLKTEVMTPLPESIIRTAGETVEADWPSWMRTPHICSGGDCGDARYVISPDGSQLAYVGTGDEGTPQIFIANVDGTGVRQMTHEPIGATWPAWSPDGAKSAYASGGAERHTITGFFVLDVATGESTQVTDGSGFMGGGVQFTPDGSSLVYTRAEPTDECSSGCAHIRTVPIAGGRVQP